MKLILSRELTRSQRYKEKKKFAVTFPLEVCCVNFTIDDNIAHAIRAAVCFGATKVNYIGSLPKYRILRDKSGSTNDQISLVQHKNPSAFLKYIRENNIKLFSSELTEDAESIWEYEFPKPPNKVCIVVGHETIGVPPEILHHSKVLYIPMPGAGYCLNTSQACNIMLNEYVKQIYNNRRRENSV